MKYVSPEYQQQLEDLADTLMAVKRQKLGQLSLFELEQQAVETVAAQPEWHDPFIDDLSTNIVLGLE